MSVSERIARGRSIHWSRTCLRKSSPTPCAVLQRADWACVLQFDRPVQDHIISVFPKSLEDHGGVWRMLPEVIAVRLYHCEDPSLMTVISRNTRVGAFTITLTKKGGTDPDDVACFSISGGADLEVRP